MAKKRKGRDISGWVIIDKPVGWGSTDVVNKVRWAFQAQKAGHAGTLDPAATGLLAVALGEATKVIPYVTDDLKAYDFTLRWGQATSTDDAEGEVIQTSDLRPSEDALRAALPIFEGDIQQVPPAFSAVKVDGQRAYDLAREGAAVELKARDLYVDSLALLDLPDADHARFELICGKGGYVRAIARDLGQNLGTCAHVTALRRTWSGPFDLEHAVSMERIEALARTEEIDTLLRPLEAGLAELPRVMLAEDGARRILNGNPGRVTASDAEFGDTAWGAYKGRAVAIGIYRAGRIAPGAGLPRRSDMIERHHRKGDADSVAAYSDCECYRYRLTRTWAPAGQKVLFVMLNPSTATEVQNDPTVERCERRARTLGFGAFRVCNIFAWRETDPAKMRQASEPVGPDNDAAILDSCAWADMIVCAWGTHGAHLSRGPGVEALMRGTGRPLLHLGLTKEGHPRHPLYIGYAVQPEPWH